MRALQEKHKSADTSVNLAAEFIILTAVRTGEARFMRVREVHLGERLWIVSAERMKTEDGPEGLCFEVPLSDRAVFDSEGHDPEGSFSRCVCFRSPGVEKSGEALGMSAEHVVSEARGGPIAVPTCKKRRKRRYLEMVAPFRYLGQVSTGQV